MQGRWHNFQSGRSMVEMLGVLAIIAILTIAGIAGFRYAMNKHYANETVDRLTKRAVVIASQRLNGVNANLDDFDENDGVYPISNTVEIKDAESFSLSVNNVPQEICSLIKTLDWTMAKMIPEDCSDTALKFKFLNDLSDCSDCVPDGVDCSQYGTECGQCSPVKGYTPNDEDCANSENGGYCVRGKCETCPSGQVALSNGCRQCSNINEVGMMAEDCHKCVDAEGNATHFMRSPGYCYKCTDTAYSFNNPSTLDECRRCSNRCFRQDISRCGIPGLSGIGSDFRGYVRRDDGKCTCAEGLYPNANGTCYTCDQINEGTVSAEDCHKCVDAEGNATHFMRSPGYCYKCTDTAYSFNNPSTLDECRRCSNRCFRQDISRCGIPGISGIGSDFRGYVRRDDGKCACAEGFYPNADGTCYACDQINEGTVSAEDCHKCVDAEGKHTHFVRTAGGYCYKCTDTGWSTNGTTTLAECNLCENRCFASDNKCYIYGPGQTYAYKDADGNCTNAP